MKTEGFETKSCDLSFVLIAFRPEETTHPSPEEPTRAKLPRHWTSRAAVGPQPELSAPPSQPCNHCRERQSQKRTIECKSQKGPLSVVMSEHKQANEPWHPLLLRLPKQPLKSQIQVSI